MAKNVDTLLILSLVLLAGLCFLQARPGPGIISDSDGTSTTISTNGTSVVAYLNSTIGSMKDETWQDFMKNLLKKYTVMYNSNVIIYKLRDEGEKHGEGKKEYSLSPKTFYPTDVLADIPLKVCNSLFQDCSDYRILAFKSSGYFETTGWYGWENWAFAGCLVHVQGSIKVIFYDCCSKPMECS